MYYIFGAVLLSFIQVKAFAFDYFRIYSKKEQSKLVGSDCEVLQNEALVLQEYTHALSKDVVKIPLQIVNGNECIQNIWPLIPLTMRNLNAKKSVLNGPNCWNTSLYLSNILKYQRFTSAKEISAWMGSDFCQKVLDESLVRSGDIMLIRKKITNISSRNSFKEIHGQIYMTPNLVFSKGTSKRSSRFGLIRTSLINSTYKVYGDCNYKFSPECRRWIDYYRCESPETIINHIENSSLKLLIKKVNLVESLISTEVIDGSLKKYEQVKKKYSNKLRLLKFKIVKLIENKTINLTRKEEFLLNAQLHAVESIEAQFRFRQ